MACIAVSDEPKEEEKLYCVECDDVLANYMCKECGDPYCDLCFRWLHNTGTRATHEKEVVLPLVDTARSGDGRTFMFKPEEKEEKVEGKTEDTAGMEVEKKDTTNEIASTFSTTDNFHDLTGIDYSILKKIARFTPLRVTTEARNKLKLLEGALDISEYTDKVDVASDSFGWRLGGKGNIMAEELDHFFNLLSGLLLAGHYKLGKKHMVGKSHEDNADFFQQVFEIGRRYKISNSDKMRSTYGKLLHIIQDAVKPNMIPFDPKMPIQTVGLLLKEKDCEDLLLDKDMRIACAEITTDGKSAEDLKSMSIEKKAARDRLISKYVDEDITENEIILCIDSIADHNSHIISNRQPVDRMIALLKEYFDPKEAKSIALSLRIRGGKGGSKLSHDHATQYHFVLQSLTLWREIMNDLFELWIFADEDMLSSSNGYRLRNTGQGLNRMQSIPNVSDKMHSILSRVQRKVGRWVGLSVVHLGDRDVPNALFFIDKYTQVPRILSPIVTVIDRIETLTHDPELNSIIIEGEFNGVDDLKRMILRDFFRHGFDGSGSDGGSCIDGRLTSAWNWCSKLEKKEYYPVFLLTGFTGFDGDFRR